MATSSVMFGSWSTTRTRAVSLFIDSMLIEIPGKLLRESWGSASICVRLGCALRAPGGPAGDAVDSSVPVDQPRGQVALLEPLGRAFAQHDRCGGGDVGVDTAARDDCRRPPDAVGGQACRRVDDVVKDRLAAHPSPDGRAR